MGWFWDLNTTHLRPRPCRLSSDPVGLGVLWKYRLAVFAEDSQRLRSLPLSLYDVPETSLLALRSISFVILPRFVLVPSEAFRCALSITLHPREMAQARRIRI